MTRPFLLANLHSATLRRQGLGLPPGVVVVRQRNNGAHREAESEYSVPADRDTRNGFRSAVPLMVSHLAAKSYKQREKKYKLYIWNFLTISCFYSLPVVQLVFVWNRTLANSGNLDLCWYNELCSRSFFGITAFNAVFSNPFDHPTHSNIGYIMLGLLFNVMVGMRDIRYNSETLQSDGDQNREIGRYGLPQHFGLLYCIGCAIMMEGVLSASYHICPSSTNFQFDTAFMYMIAALGLLRIYQMRHPDINANSHVAYATMAGIILFGMVGVYFNSAVVYALFSAFYAVILISVSCEFYYKGSWKLNVSAVHPRNLLPSASLPSRLLHCVVPAHKGRFMFLIVGNAGNVALLIYGLLARPTDFPSFLLTIFIMNLLLYTFYYIVMKIRFREYLSLHSVVVIILAAIAWSISLFFYMQKSTSWHIPPADSRTMNRPCVLFDFYDLHDCWHFSSALALFLSFTTLLCIDDNVRFVPQNALRVF